MSHYLTPIYYITHISNLPSILKEDGPWCDNNRVEQGFPIIGIAHQNIKERRAKRTVPLAANGVLADYVPFYFAPRSPMLYAIHKGMVESYEGGQAAVLHLLSSAETAANAGQDWCFTDGHAEMAMTQFSDDLGRLGEFVDREIMEGRYWNETPEQPDRKRRRQAEFLVRECFPWKLISTIGVHDSAIAKKVAKLIANEEHGPAIEVRPEWYY